MVKRYRPTQVSYNKTIMTPFKKLSRQTNENQRNKELCPHRHRDTWVKDTYPTRNTPCLRPLQDSPLLVSLPVYGRLQQCKNGQNDISKEVVESERREWRVNCREWRVNEKKTVIKGFEDFEENFQDKFLQRYDKMDERRMTYGKPMK